MIMAVVKIIVSLAVLTLLSTAWQVEAATITAASCSRAAVGSAVTSASDGDVVLVPAGTCSWTTTLTITKGITLQGAGIGQTVILDGITPHTSPLLVWNVAAPRSWRMTGIEFKNGTTGSNLNGIIHLAGNSPAFRVDHCRFGGLIGRALDINGSVFGVVDHNQFTNDGGGGPHYIIFRNGKNWKGVGDYGDNSWATPSNYGSSEWVFIEDNTFGGTSNGSFDADNGARFVFRFNTFTNTTIETHGTESTGRPRGFRVAEIYNNTFTDTTPSASQVIHFRSGTGVIWNNKVNGYQWGGDLLHTDNYRDSSFSPTEWGGFCDGDAPYDQNTPGTAGYACVDQVGRGPGALLSGWTPTPRAWPNQVLEPVYLWNNTLNGAYQHRSGSAKIQNGRDVFMDTPKPGYVPYVYPHPLVGPSVGPSVAPSFPTGVTAR